jgi:excisionase family DNA binding protein
MSKTRTRIKRTFSFEPLRDYTEMAEDLNLSVRELRSLVYRGIIPHLRLGHRTIRFQPSRVHEALKRREIREMA